jgi:hypothetical protein
MEIVFLYFLTGNNGWVSIFSNVKTCVNAFFGEYNLAS